MKKRTKKGEELTALVLRIFEVYGVLMDHGDRLTAPMGETPARWKVMGAVSIEPLSVSQIARRMGLSRQAVLKTTNVLRKNGQVESIENIDNVRSPKIRLTKKGEKTLAAINNRQVEWINGLADDLNLKSIQNTLVGIEALEKALDK